CPRRYRLSFPTRRSSDLVFVSIVLGTAGLGEPAKLGKIGLQTISFFLVTTAIALTIGMSVGLILKPGKAVVFDTSNAEFSEQTRSEEHTSELQSRFDLVC